MDRPLLPTSERERERVAILAQVLHLFLGACAALLYGGEDGELTRGCVPGELFRSTQWCLSSTPVATLLKRPLVLPAPLQILKEAPLRGVAL